MSHFFVVSVITIEALWLIAQYNLIDLTIDVTQESIQLLESQFNNQYGDMFYDKLATLFP